jgi:SAM-dependent methyltransferase
VAQESYFTDGAAYERHMARWTCGAGTKFLDWIAPPGGARWLDVGCGTGAFTELLIERCAPAAVTAVDPAAAQVELARGKPVGGQADFRVADAQELPFPDASFDVVASALVINFIPNRPRALAEMRRVGRPGGLVAGYVWDFAGGRGAAWPLRRGLSRLGIKIAPVPGTEDSHLEALSALFTGAGLEDIAVLTIEVTTSFADFDEYWRTQVPPYNPVGKAVASLSAADRDRLIDRVRADLPARPDGRVSYTAHANAIKARVPK